jgi:hypothetical protein
MVRERLNRVPGTWGSGASASGRTHDSVTMPPLSEATRGEEGVPSGTVGCTRRYN